jgi:hypothetical protein
VLFGLLTFFGGYGRMVTWVPLGPLKPSFESGAPVQLKLSRFYREQEHLLAPGPVAFFELTLLDAALILGR